MSGFKEALKARIAAIRVERNTKMQTLAAAINSESWGEVGDLCESLCRMDETLKHHPEE